MSKGFNAGADVLTQTIDGRPLNEIWAEFQATTALQSESRQTIVDLLTYSVTNPIEDVAQFGLADFEDASEYGVPVGIRPGPSYLSLGYGFKWYDLAVRYTWQFLAEATAAQVEVNNQMALEADNRKIFTEVMKTLFRNTNTTANIKQQNFNVYTFWNADGTIPPAYKNNTFDGTHTHFRASGAATVNSGDLDEIVDDFKSHGYSVENGTQHILLANSVEVNVIRGFRVSGGSRFDFIPAVGQPGLLLPTPQNMILTSQPASTYQGMNVAGTYGNLLIIEEDYVPAGYIIGLASGGRASLNNPIGFREHANPALRGLRLVKGRDSDYPLIDSYYVRGFGTGVRQRGAAMVMKITAGSYTIPTAYA